MGENERIAALHARRILDTPAEERFDRVTRLARRLFDVDEALVNLIDRDRQWTKSTSNGPAGSGNEIPRGQSFCHTTLGSGDPNGIVVEDAITDARFRDHPYVTCDHPIRFYAGIPLAAPGGELVGTLCLVDYAPRRLSDADRALLHDLARWVEKELNIDRELDRAASVQRALLPATTIDDPNWDIAGLCRPSRDVGGDFYDWYHRHDHTAVTLADVMGKGLPAAIVAATARAALRAAASADTPGAQLAHATATLAPDLHATGTFVTAFIAHLGMNGHITYADAGHGHTAIHRRHTTTEPLARGTAPIGIADARPATHLATLAPGDLLIAHSDGLLELANGPRTTADALATLTAAPTAADALAHLTASLGSTPPPDDVTVLVIRRTA